MSGIGFVVLLTFTLIVAKLLHLLAWPWLLVLSPLWISAVVCPVLYLAATACMSVKK